MDLTLEEAFKTAAQLNEKLKKRNSLGHPSKKFKILINKRRKLVAKMIHQKENTAHRTSKIVKSGQSYSTGPSSSKAG